MQMIQLVTKQGVIAIVDEPTYSFGSADNVRAYPFEMSLDGQDITSVHGVMLDSQPTAVFGASGGNTGVHQHSAVYLDDKLYLVISNRIICMTIKPIKVVWNTTADSFTCFAIHLHPATGNLLSHGEIEISSLDLNGNLLWQSGGADIFTGPISFDETTVSVEDFEGRRYRFSVFDGSPIDYGIQTARD
jgi:outer membrane protein assembly factor BamB